MWSIEHNAHSCASLSTRCKWRWFVWRSARAGIAPATLRAVVRFTRDTKPLLSANAQTFRSVGRQINHSIIIHVLLMVLLPLLPQLLDVLLCVCVMYYLSLHKHTNAHTHTYHARNEEALDVRSIVMRAVFVTYIWNAHHVVRIPTHRPFIHIMYITYHHTRDCNSVLKWFFFSISYCILNDWQRFGCIQLGTNCVQCICNPYHILLAPCNLLRRMCVVIQLGRDGSCDGVRIRNRPHATALNGR